MVPGPPFFGGFAGIFAAEPELMYTYIPDTHLVNQIIETRPVFPIYAGKSTNGDKKFSFLLLRMI